MKTNPATDAKAVELLQRILDHAAEVGADMVDLERVPEGLEILYCAGPTGVGGLLETPELEAPLVDLIVRRARLTRKSEGSFTCRIQGQTRTIAVEEYDSFGEACFRLKLGSAG